MIKRILFFLLVIFVLLTGIVLVNTARFTSKQLDIATVPAPEIPDSALLHFQEAIRHKTISFADPSLFDSSQFLGFRKFLEIAYPLVHEKLSREIIASYSLLYKWEGKNNSLNPFVLMAHQDVVPIEEASQKLWTVEPFGGEVRDGFIWGRGTVDDKIDLISIFEVIEKLLRENFQPERTIYFAFGHDEEVGGTGAIAIAGHLKKQNISADLVLDEGGIITLDKVPGMTKPVALIGTSEKGYLSLQLSVEKNGGHSSMPEPETALDILAKALVKLRENPFEADFSPSTQGFIEHVGPEMPFFQKMVFANTWLFKGVVIGIYEQSAGGNALVRTTAVPTILHAGIKDNIIPTLASATVNFRLLPGDNSEKITRLVKEIVNDTRVNILPLSGFVAESSSVSPEDGLGYQLVNQTIRKTFEETITTPFLMIGGTDSRHFKDVSTNIIKFSPMIDPIGFHGIDERVSLESFRKALWFYEQLLREAK